MPTPRAEVAVAELDGLLYVVGGFDQVGAPTATVEVYDPATDTRMAAAPLPRPRHHAAAAGLGGRLYVIGGFEQSFSDPQTTLFV